MKRNFLITLLFVGCIFNVNAYADMPISKATTQAKQADLEPEKALKMLNEGNKRFINNELRSYDFEKEMKVTTIGGQHPIAIILNCVDSRSIPDILFDQGIGNIFVARIAGNIATPELIGSMEFATQAAGAPLIVVMGHTHCGAVQGACASGGHTGLKNLDKLLAFIEPAVKKLNENGDKKKCNNPVFVDEIAKQNVINQLNLIKENSDVVSRLVKDKKVMIVGAMHNIKTGEVKFFDVNGKNI